MTAMIRAGAMRATWMLLLLISSVLAQPAKRKEATSDELKQILTMVLPPDGGDNALPEIRRWLEQYEQESLPTILLAARDPEKRTPCHRAAEAGQHKTLGTLLDSAGAKAHLLLDARDKHQSNVLDVVLERGPLASIESSLRVISRFVTGRDDLLDSVAEQKLLTRLRQLGPPAGTDPRTEVPLWLPEELARGTRFGAGKQPRQRLDDGSNALLVASGLGQHAVMQSLLETDFLGQENLRGSTDLHAAAACNDETAVILLLRQYGERAGEAIRHRDKAGITPLHYIYCNGNVSLLRGLSTGKYVQGMVLDNSLLGLAAFGQELGVRAMDVKGEMADELDKYIALVTLPGSPAVFRPVIKGQGYLIPTGAVKAEKRLSDLRAFLAKGGALPNFAYDPKPTDNLRQALVIEDAIASHRNSGSVPSQAWLDDLKNATISAPRPLRIASLLNRLQGLPQFLYIESIGLFPAFDSQQVREVYAARHVFTGRKSKVETANPLIWEGEFQQLPPNRAVRVRVAMQVDSEGNNPTGEFNLRVRTAKWTGGGSHNGGVGNKNGNKSPSWPCRLSFPSPGDPPIMTSETGTLYLTLEVARLVALERTNSEYNSWANIAEIADGQRPREASCALDSIQAGALIEVEVVGFFPEN